MVRLFYSHPLLASVDKGRTSMTQYHNEYYRNISECRMEQNPQAKVLPLADLYNLARLHVEYLKYILNLWYLACTRKFIEPFAVSIIHHVPCWPRVNEMKPGGQSSGRGIINSSERFFP